MVISHQHGTALAMPKMRTAPIAVIRGHAPHARKVIARVMQHPRSRLFRRLRSDTFFEIGSVYRLASAVGDVNGGRRPAYIGVRPRGEVFDFPKAWPITPAKTKICFIVRDVSIRYVRRIELVKLFEFPRLRRAEHQISR